MHHSELSGHGKHRTLNKGNGRIYVTMGGGTTQCGVRMLTFDAVSVVPIADDQLSLCQTSNLGVRTSELRRRGAHEGNEACGVDDAPAGVQALGRVRGVLTHG